MIHLQCFFHQANHITGIDFREIVQGSTELAKFTSCDNGLGVSVWWTLWRGGCFLRGPQVSAVGLTVCSKFLGLKMFGSFKGFKWMGRVLKLAKISSYFIKFSVREKDDLFSEISWLESSLNVLKISLPCSFFYFTLM